MRSTEYLDSAGFLPGDSGNDVVSVDRLLSRPRLGIRKESTASVVVRNSTYPAPVERNLTRLSLWPSLGSKLKGNRPYSALMSMCRSGLTVASTVAVARAGTAV